MMRRMAAERFRRLQQQQTTSRHVFAVSPRRVVLLSVGMFIVWLFFLLNFLRAPAPQIAASHPPQIFRSFEQREAVYRTRHAELERKTTKLSDEEAFYLRFGHSALTKSVLKGAKSPSHCDLRGPGIPSHWSPKRQSNLKKLLASKSGVTEAEIETHMANTGAQLLSLDHKLCTSNHAYPCLDAFLGEAHSLRARDSRSQPFSAYVFEDVCVTFNIDSVKRAQRALVVFDDTNNHPQRCSPCPNPQMNKDWGSNECGMMWLHQMNVKSLRDFNRCYDANRQQIKEQGQRQEPGETKIVAALYYPKTTLLVQFVQQNPGHQLWDFLFSVFPILLNQNFKTPLFDHTVSHQAPSCNGRLWSCQILRRLGVFESKSDSKEENLIPVFPGVLTCFEKLIAPIPGWNHDNAFMKAGALQAIRTKLLHSFELDTGIEFSMAQMVKELTKFAYDYSDTNIDILLYPHSTSGEAGKRRAWLDVTSTFEALVGKNLRTKVIDDFSKVSVEEQARLFASSQLQVMSHGGQFGNSIFARKNTMVVEVTCGKYSHMSLGGHYTKGLELFHVVYSPCDCIEGYKDEANYNLPIEELQQVIRAFLSSDPLEYGSYHRQCDKPVATGD